MTPSVGTIVRGREIDAPERYASQKYVWAKCPTLDCGYERWVFHRVVNPSQRYCKTCAIAGSGREFQHGRRD